MNKRAQTPADRTVLAALLFTALCTTAMMAFLWPDAQTADDPYALTEFVDASSGRQQIIAYLGPIALRTGFLADLEDSANAYFELRAQGPTPTERGLPEVSIALIVEGSKPALLQVGTETSIAIGAVEGPIVLDRIEIEIEKKIISGLHGEIPWALLIGLATGAPGELKFEGQGLPFGPRTTAQALAVLRRLQVLGFEFPTFELDLAKTLSPRP